MAATERLKTKRENKMEAYKLCDGTQFTVSNGEVFGIGGTDIFIQNILRVCKLLAQNPEYTYMQVSGYTITRG